MKWGKRQKESSDKINKQNSFRHITKENQGKQYQYYLVSVVNSSQTATVDKSFLCSEGLLVTIQFTVFNLQMKGFR